MTNPTKGERYRLLKDLPGYDAGTIFERNEELSSGWQVVADSSGVDKAGNEWHSVYAESVGQTAQVLDATYSDPQWFERIPETSTNDSGPGGEEEPMSERTREQELEAFLRSEISDAAESMHTLHQLEQPYSAAANLLVSRIMEQHRTLISNAVTTARVEELEAADKHFRSIGNLYQTDNGSAVHDYLNHRIATLTKGDRQ